VEESGEKGKNQKGGRIPESAVQGREECRALEGKKNTLASAMRTEQRVSY